MPEWRNGRRSRLKPGGPQGVGVRVPPPAPWMSRRRHVPPGSRPVMRDVTGRATFGPDPSAACGHIYAAQADRGRYRGLPFTECIDDRGEEICGPRITGCMADSRLRRPWLADHASSRGREVRASSPGGSWPGCATRGSAWSAGAGSSAPPSISGRSSSGPLPARFSRSSPDMRTSTACLVPERVSAGRRGVAAPSASVAPAGWGR